MPKFVVAQNCRLLTDCQKIILIEAKDQDTARELYEKKGEEAGEILRYDEFDCEVYDEGDFEIELFHNFEEPNE